MKLNSIAIIILGMSLIFLSYVSSDRIKNLEQKLEQFNNIHQIINTECVEILTYTQFGRMQILCYMGDNHNYNSNERRVIEQWKEHK